MRCALKLNAMKAVSYTHLDVYKRQAQNPHGNDHSWFIAYAPADDPKIAICVLVENAGFGATVAAPIAQRIILKYLLGLTDESEVRDSFGER